MTKITIELDDQLAERLATISRAEDQTVKEWLEAQARRAVQPLIGFVIENPSHRAILASLHRPDGYYESPRDESYDRERNRAELYVKHRAELLELIDNTEGDFGAQTWNRESSMIPDCFLDTNVLFYAALGRRSAPEKYRRARAIVAETNFATSGQVLQEFYVNVTRKSDKPLTSEQALTWISRLIDRPCAAVDHELVVRGAEIASRYRISYWDGAILAGAERTGARTLYTEDLNDGQDYGSVRAINPFKPN